MAKKIDLNGLDHFKEKENAMIASEYSSSKTYAVGDYCYYAGTLYCCTTAITTAENWTSGHWTAAKLADDCSALKTVITQLTQEVEATFEQKTITNVPIASFDDGADNVPVKKLIVDIEPVQSGSGNPSPTNVRPITGWTGANVTRTGVNVWDEEWEVGGYYNASGLPWATNDRIRSKNYIPVKPNTTYYQTLDSFSALCYYDNNKNFIIGVGLSGHYFTTPRNCYFIRFAVPSSYGATYNSNISINYPSTDTTYHAYIGTTYSITFPDAAGTVYGGTLDVTNGVLTVDKVTKTISSSDSFYSFAKGTANANALVYLDPVPYIGSENSSYNGAASSTGKENQKYWASQRQNENPTNGHYSFALGSNFVRFYMTEDYSDISDAAGFKSAFVETQLVYTLATPVIYTLTPTEVATLLGQNNVWADCGDIDELTYRAMNNTDAKIALTQAIIAPVLDSMVADTALVANDFRIVDNTLYRITTSVASGATLTPNTNCTATTIAEILKSLLT